MSENSTTDLPAFQNGGDLHKSDAMALEFDASRYLGDMSDFEVTEQQKIELLQTLWSIMRSMVDLGFSHDLCEQILESFNESAQCEGCTVKSVLPTMREATDETE